MLNNADKVTDDLIVQNLFRHQNHKKPSPLKLIAAWHSILLAGLHLNV